MKGLKLAITDLWSYGGPQCSCSIWGEVNVFLQKNNAGKSNLRQNPAMGHGKRFAYEPREGTVSMVQTWIHNLGSKRKDNHTFSARLVSQFADWTRERLRRDEALQTGGDEGRAERVVHVSLAPRVSTYLVIEDSRGRR